MPGRRHNATLKNLLLAIRILATALVVVLGIYSLLLEAPPSFRNNTASSLPPKAPLERLLPEELPAEFLLIAHAGGEVAGVYYSNSLEALNASYDRGFRVFEVDLSWTSDGRLALCHDWGRIYRFLFFDTGGQPTLEEFMNLKMVKGLTQLSLEGLIRWVAARPEVYVIIDAKADAVATLSVIVDKGARQLDQFIPQVYDPPEYEPVRAMGFTRIIFTIYRSRASDEEIVRFCRARQPFALAAPYRRLLGSALAKRLTDTDLPLLAHTVNHSHLLTQLREIGIRGIFTDRINPGDDVR